MVNILTYRKIRTQAKNLKLKNSRILQEFGEIFLLNQEKQQDSGADRPGGFL